MYRKRTANIFTGVCGFFVIVLFSGCSTTLEIDEIRQSRIFVDSQPVSISVPFFAQDEYQCGPAALAMLLNWSNVDVSPEKLTPLVYVPAKQGSFPLEIVAASRQFDRIPYVITPGMTDLIEELQAGNPVLVFQNLGLDWLPNWHFAVVTGIDLAANSVTLHSGTIEGHTMTIDKFERTWARAKKWALVITKPGDIPKTAKPVEFIKAVTYFELNGKTNIAKAGFLAALKRWPEDLIVLMAIANYSFALKDFEAASQYYSRVISIKEDYAPAHNNMALVLLEMGNPIEAKQHAETAVRLGGSRADSYHDTLQQVDNALEHSAR